MVNIENFLDLYDLFVNEIVGDIWLFVFLGIIGVVIFSLKKKMPFQISLMLSALWLILIFVAVPSLKILYILAVFGIAIFLYWMIARAWRRG